MVAAYSSNRAILERLMQLSAFIPKLQNLGASALPVVYQKIADGGLQLINRGFEDETDPYGKKWKYVKEHPGHSSILHDSGTLKGSFRAPLISNGVKFYSTCVYANKQNYTRPMLPTDALGGLPPAWKALITRSVNSTIKQVLGL